MRSFRRASASLVVLLLAALAAAGPAAAYTPLTPDQVVAKLNQLRAAHGLPARVVEVPALSRGCQLHNRWMTLNRRMQHDEPTGTRGYTTAGDRAGNTSVLANAGSWRTGSPWLNAPLHLVQVLDPALSATGASEAYGHNCLVTLGAGTSTPFEPAEHTLSSYPGPGQVVPFYQLVYEAPISPQTVRPDPIPANQPTGPALLVWYDGPLESEYTASLDRFVLSGPSGVVPTKVVTQQQLGMYLAPDTAIVFPKRPLEPGATYRMRTTWSSYQGNGVSTEPWTTVRAFRTTGRRLCGAGRFGWYREVDCPRFGPRIARVVGPRTASRMQAVRGLRYAIRMTPRAPVVGTARIGGSRVGRATGRASSRGYASVVVRVDPAKLAARLAAAGGPVTVAVTFQSRWSQRTAFVRVAP